MSRPTSAFPSRSSGPKRWWHYVIVALLIAAAYWYQEKYLGGSAKFEEAVQGRTAKETEKETGTRTASTTPKAKKTQPAKKISVTETEKSPAPAPPPTAAKTSKINGYDKLEGCRLVDHRDNDGDSFHVRHGDREFELRLYYVDTPEKYLSDRYEDQRRRVAEQGRDFGGLSPEQTVEVGKAAKLYTARLLEGKTFTVYTKWEAVYDSDRVYAFVDLPDGEDTLIEVLVEKGLGLIHTKGETTPDGLSYQKYKARLEALQRAAQDADRGGWGLN